jgi:hypothetical protein
VETAKDELTLTGIAINLGETAYVDCAWGSVAIEPDSEGINIYVYPLWVRNEPTKEFKVYGRELQEENDENDQE